MSYTVIPFILAHMLNSNCGRTHRLFYRSVKLTPDFLKHLWIYLVNFRHSSAFSIFPSLIEWLHVQQCIEAVSFPPGTTFAFPKISKNRVLPRGKISSRRSTILRLKYFRPAIGGSRLRWGFNMFILIG